MDFLAGYGYVEGKPKTAAGRRVISLPAFLLDMLKHHQVQQLALRKASDHWEDHDLCFLISGAVTFILIIWVKSLGGC